MKKTVLPTTILIFVWNRNWLRTNGKKKRLANDKLDKIRDLLSEFLNRRKVTLKELQSLIGFLNFACSVVAPGRTFRRRLIDLTIGVKHPNHKKRLNKEVKRDLQAWSLFIQYLNGKSGFLPDKWTNWASLDLFSDASYTDFGAYFGNGWFGNVWPDTWKQYHITLKELFPIVLAVELWADQWNKRPKMAWIAPMAMKEEALQGY